MTNVETTTLGSYQDLMVDRSGFQHQFSQWLCEEPGIHGRVLDIGCGPNLPGGLSPIKGLPAQLDGVDPIPAVERHPLLTERWSGEFEQAPIPESAYDLAYSYNVLEHIPAARPFFQKVAGVLKSGGVFWALTPHALHPFCKLVRLVQAAKLKSRYARDRQGVNEYPSYYRLNSVRQVTTAIEGLGFSSCRFYYLPCMQWDRYFPAPLRFIPHLYDRLLGVHRGRSMLLLSMRLEKAT